MHTPTTNPPGLAICALLLALIFSPQATAQVIPNPSFEATVLAPSATPFLVGGEASAAAAPWGFGGLSGICREGVAYAERLDAAEGHQVAFLQGDPSRAPEEDRTQPYCVFGVDMTGLEPGEEYEIQWSQASRATDANHGAITVILTDPANPASNLVLVEKLAVTNKEEWEVKKESFTATAETMRLNVLHTIPDLESGGNGDESTLLDDFRLRKLE